MTPTGLEDSTLITETNLCTTVFKNVLLPLCLSITVVQLSPVRKHELKWFACWHWMEKWPKKQRWKCTALALTHLYCTVQWQYLYLKSEVTENPLGWSTVTDRFYPKLLLNSWIIISNPAQIIVFRNTLQTPVAQQTHRKIIDSGAFGTFRLGYFA